MVIANLTLNKKLFFIDSLKFNFQKLTIQVAKQFQEELQPLVEWLGVTERKVKILELVPTDEEKIQLKIREHKVLVKLSYIYPSLFSSIPLYHRISLSLTTLMVLQVLNVMYF